MWLCMWETLCHVSGFVCTYILYIYVIDLFISAFISQVVNLLDLNHQNILSENGFTVDFLNNLCCYTVLLSRFECQIFSGSIFLNLDLLLSFFLCFLFLSVILLKILDFRVLDHWTYNALKRHHLWLWKICGAVFCVKS